MSGCSRQQVLVARVGDHDRAVPAEGGRGASGALLEVRFGHHHLEIGVVEQVRQLLVDVAEVDVDGDGAELERRQARLHVLVAVIEVTTDVVAGPDAHGRQRMREAVGASVELGERETHLGPCRRPHHQRLPLGDRPRDGLEDVCHVQSHNAPGGSASPAA